MPASLSQPPLRIDEEISFHLLKALLKRQATRYHLAENLIANSDELKLLIRKSKQTRLFTGFRKEVFGLAALKLLAGQSSFKAEMINDKVTWHLLNL